MSIDGGFDLQTKPVRNTLGGKTYPFSETKTVRGTIHQIDRSKSPLWTLWLVPDDPDVIHTIREYETELYQRYARSDQTVRSTIEPSEPARIRVHLPTDPVPPPNIQPGTRITAHLTSTGFHVFLDDCGITWRVSHLTFHRPRSTCLFKSSVT